MKLLYILNVANRVNNFSYSGMCAAKGLGMEFHIAGNWGYSSDAERVADEKKYEIKIHQIDFERSPLSPKNKKAYHQLCELMKTENYDVVHCNTPIGGLLGRICGKKYGIDKMLYQVHGFHFYKGAPKKNWLLYYPVEKWLARYTDALVTINTEDFAFAKENLKLRKKDSVYYVPGVGIDLDSISINPKKREIKRSELSLGEDDIVLISVGELNTNKNNQVIIKALAKLKNPKLHYILCGVGEERESLETLAKQNGLENNIHFLGYRTDVMDIYSASDIFVMPSFREGLSRSIMEAMANGLPCVVSDIRGNVDMIEQEKGGYLCSPSDVDAFAEAIDILSKDLQLRENIKQFNLEKVKQFSTSVATEEMKKIYSKEFFDFV